MTQQNAVAMGLAQPAERHWSAFLFVIIFLGLAMMLVWGAKPARAGDFAQPAILGYSEDLRYFAFEEYGIEDASGFPYSSIYFIDLKNNSPVANAVVNIRFDAQDDPLPGELVAVRQKARQKAQIWLDRLKIGWPAEMLAYNGDGVPELEGLFVRFGVTGYNGAVIGDYRLSLEMVDFDSILECEKWAPSKPQGLVLTITDYDFQKSEVYRDKSLPKSGNCPLSYKISGVFAPFQANDISNAVALVSVYLSGWEGEDRRFIVVPIGRDLK